ncbi:hypothetical protein SHIRM173S_10033 [Streptomyces hirsutus]
MTAVLWVLAIPSLALGGFAFRVLPDWFDGHDLTPILTTSVLGTGMALVGGIVTYATWRHTTAHAAHLALGAVAAHPERGAGQVEAEAIASHEPVYGDIALQHPTRRTPDGCCSAPCTATRPPASTSTPCTRPSSSGPSRPRPDSSGSSTARSSTPMYAARERCPGGSAPPYDVPRPAICRPM